jgi:hypothetical protein
MTCINNLNEIFKKYINYNTINAISDVKMRNGKISLSNCFLYSFLYTQIHATKETIAAGINNPSHNPSTRGAYDAKLANIPVAIFENMFTEAKKLYYSLNKNTNKFTSIAVDGTYNLIANMI